MANVLLPQDKVARLTEADVLAIVMTIGGMLGVECGGAWKCETGYWMQVRIFGDWQYVYTREQWDGYIHEGERISAWMDAGMPPLEEWFKEPINQ